MSSSNNRTTWRQREAEKSRAEQLKRFAKTEENFPTTFRVSSDRAVSMPGMSDRILEAHIQEEVRKQVEAYRSAMQARERRNLMNSVFLFNRSSGGYQEEESDAGSYIIVEEEKWPGHGKRGTYTEPDEEGWRTVTKRLRRKRELTDAELERKWRADILNEEEEEQEQADYNGELLENGQRRDFY
jgi:hypothetical protein